MNLHNSVIRLKSTIDQYISQYFDELGQLPLNMQLKRDHTNRVVDNIKLIADAENFDNHCTILCQVAAMLHDIGRYEQLKVYGTFSDAKSIDHAELSYQIVKMHEWLADINQDDKDIVLNTVRFHNKRDLPVGLNDDCLLVSKALRDADKIDILKVIEDQLSAPDWRSHSDIWWDLPVVLPPNQLILNSIEKCETPRYVDIDSLVDFLLVQLAWMCYGMNFKTSKDLCFSRKHVDFRIKFLKMLAGDQIDDALKHVIS